MRHPSKNLESTHVGSGTFQREHDWREDSEFGERVWLIQRIKMPKQAGKRAAQAV